MIFHSSEKKARFMLWTTALIWGGGFVAGKMALTGLSPWGVLFWRFGLAALLFLLPFHKAIMGQGRRVLWFGILSGVLLALSLAVQLLGLSYTTSARQSFLFTTYVAWTPFVREKGPLPPLFWRCWASVSLLPEGRGKSAWETESLWHPLSFLRCRSCLWESI